MTDPDKKLKELQEKGLIGTENDGGLNFLLAIVFVLSILVISIIVLH